MAGPTARDILEMNRRLEKEAREEVTKGGGVIHLGAGDAPSKPPDDSVMSGTAPVISSESGTAGTAATALRSDTLPGLQLVGTPGDTVDDTATLYPSIEAVKKTAGDRRGFRVRVGKNYDDQAQDYPSLEITNAAGGASGLRVKYAHGGAIRTNANGLAVPVKADSGLEVDTGATGGLAVKLKSGGGISVDGDGLKLTSTPAAPMTLARYDFSTADSTFTADGAWHTKDLSGTVGANAVELILYLESTTGQPHFRRTGDTYNDVTPANTPMQLTIQCAAGQYDYKIDAAATMSVRLLRSLNQP
jgi:hypothetical protein